MKIRVVIQARMGSTRLRGKTLSAVEGIPLLKRVIDTALNLNLTTDVVVVTSDCEEDNPIESYCKEFLDCNCVRGDLNDVFSRFILAASNLNDKDILVRLTADNLFYQPEICQKVLEIHNQNNNDYSGISGLSHIVCELIRVGALRGIDEKLLSEYDREHVTPFFINNPTLFKMDKIDPKVFELQQGLDKQLTLDTIEDRERIESIIRYFSKHNLKYNQQDLYGWLALKNKNT